MKGKPKVCVICQSGFYPARTTQRVCSPLCALQFAEQKERKKQEKAFRREINQRREALKTRSDYLREAQTECNRYIRKRDEILPCISCGRYHKGKWNAGHYRTVKAASQLRFHPFNIHKQCEPCNSNLSGNIVEYRINLINRIGEKNVIWLENNNTFHRWTKEEAIEIKAYYKDLLKNML